jgi:hypothetical protein
LAYVGVVRQRANAFGGGFREIHVRALRDQIVSCASAGSTCSRLRDRDPVFLVAGERRLPVVVLRDVAAALLGAVAGDVLTDAGPLDVETDRVHGEAVDDGGGQGGIARPRRGSVPSH